MFLLCFSWITVVFEAHPFSARGRTLLLCELVTSVPVAGRQVPLPAERPDTASPQPKRSLSAWTRMGKSPWTNRTKISVYRVFWKQLTVSWWTRSPNTVLFWTQTPALDLPETLGHRSRSAGSSVARGAGDSGALQPRGRRWHDQPVSRRLLGSGTCSGTGPPGAAVQRSRLPGDSQDGQLRAPGKCWWQVWGFPPCSPPSPRTYVHGGGKAEDTFF